MIFIQETYTVFLVFSPKKNLLDTSTFSISTRFKKFFFQFQIRQTVRFLYHFYISELIFTFYNDLLLSVKWVFCIKFVTSLLLIPLIPRR